MGRALANQMKAAIHQPQIDLASIADPLTAFTWRGIFARIEKTYFDLMRTEDDRPPS